MEILVSDKFCARKLCKNKWDCLKAHWQISKNAVSKSIADVINSAL